MSKMKDGGPAFPMPDSYIPDDHRGFEAGHNGMSLRDWFAGQALIGISVSDRFVRNDYSNQEQAAWAYELADAMLAARLPSPPKTEDEG